MRHKRYKFRMDLRHFTLIVALIIFSIAVLIGYFIDGYIGTLISFIVGVVSGPFWFVSLSEYNRKYKILEIR